MTPNIESLRTQNERRQIAYVVNGFLQDSDAILTAKENPAIHWRIQYLAETGFLDCVERRQQWGYLLYLHDASSLKGGAQ